MKYGTVSKSVVIMRKIFAKFRDNLLRRSANGMLSYYVECSGFEESSSVCKQQCYASGVSLF